MSRPDQSPVEGPAGLVEDLRLRYGILADLERLRLGADPATLAYRVRSGARRWFVKLQPRAATGRLELAAALTHHLGTVVGLGEVLAPVADLQGRAAGHLDGWTVVVWPYVEAVDGFRQRQDQTVLDRVGRTLRTLHDARLPPELLVRLPTAEVGAGFRRRIRDLLGSGVEGGSLSGQAELEQLLRRHRERILGLVDAMDSLEPRLRPPSATAGLVPCHGDLHAGNVLVDGSGRVLVVDWDDACLARPELDLMAAGAGIEGTWSAPGDTAALLGGYGAATDRPIDQVAVAFFRCRRILLDVAVVCAVVRDPAGDPAARAAETALLAAQFRPGAVVEVAERTVAAQERSPG